MILGRYLRKFSSLTSWSTMPESQFPKKESMNLISSNVLISPFEEVGTTLLSTSCPLESLNLW